MYLLKHLRLIDCGISLQVLLHPSLTQTMEWLVQIHHDSKHPNVAWDPASVTNVHAEVGGVTTAGVAVRGSKKK